jgi:hypothetical protein
MAKIGLRQFRSLPGSHAGLRNAASAACTKVVQRLLKATSDQCTLTAGGSIMKTGGERVVKQPAGEFPLDDQKNCTNI